MKKSKSTLQRSKDMKGFSLIEVIIAMGIMSIGLLAVAAMQISTVRNNKTGNTFTQASALARAQMETIKNGNINNAGDLLNPTPTVPPTTTSDPAPVDENGNPGGIYTRSSTMDAYLVGGAVSNFARTVTVNVRFPFSGRGIRTVSLTSVVTGGGL